MARQALRALYGCIHLSVHKNRYKATKLANNDGTDSRLVRFDADHGANNVVSMVQRGRHDNHTDPLQTTNSYRQTQGQSLSVQRSSLVGANIRCTSVTPPHTGNPWQCKRDVWNSSRVQHTSVKSLNQEKDATKEKMQKSGDKRVNSQPLPYGKHTLTAVAKNKIFTQAPATHDLVEHRPKFTRTETQLCSCTDCQWCDTVMALPGFDIFSPTTVESELVRAALTTNFI